MTKFYDDADDAPKRDDIPSQYLTFVGQAKDDGDRARRNSFAGVLHRWSQHHVATRKCDMSLAEIENYWSEFGHRGSNDLRLAFEGAAREDRFWPSISVLRQHLPKTHDPIAHHEGPDSKRTPEEIERGHRYMRYAKWVLKFKEDHSTYESNMADMKLFVEHGHVPAEHLKKYEVTK